MEARRHDRTTALRNRAATDGAARGRNRVIVSTPAAAASAPPHRYTAAAAAAVEANQIPVFTVFPHKQRTAIQLLIVQRVDRRRGLVR